MVFNVQNLSLLQDNFDVTSLRKWKGQSCVKKRYMSDMSLDQLRNAQRRSSFFFYLHRNNCSVPLYIESVSLVILNKQIHSRIVV